ncbi:MAG: hypothetical protein A2293_03300 [Elusimicrobia bacterium RIFOXYB2_FULL_49_7]|nr:MAG: hypothetical protein A2293_03300 [Elusimicrobia bacterium RIFOXYB2_FULL_49_7]
MSTLFSGINLLLLSLLGLAVGMLGSLFGVGGGIIMVPALVLVVGLTQKSAQGISLAVIIPMALMSLFRYYNNPDVVMDFRIIVILSIAAIIGANIGSTVVSAVSNRTLQLSFGLLLVVMGIYMAVKAMRG